MRYIHCSGEEFLEQVNNKRIIHIGASEITKKYADYYDIWFKKIVNQIEFIVDNDSDKHGKEMVIANQKKIILPFSEIKNAESTVLVVGTSYKFIGEIVKQLEDMELPDEMECYCLPLMLENGIDVDKLENIAVDFPTSNKYLNEKIIHCCWFSGEEKPSKYQECLDSWKKFCPDYQIIEWNANNYDFDKNAYLKEAFERRKWAFASDYVRLDVVYQYGGIYLDMDVELLKNIDDLLNLKAFFCYDWVNDIDLGSGFGAMKNDTLVKKLLDTYKDLHFVDKDGNPDITPQPTRLKSCFEEIGLTGKGTTQIIDDRYFLSGKYFSVYDGRNKEEFAWKGNEYGLHWHNAGWFDEKRMERRNNKNLDKEKTYYIFNGGD